MLERQPTRSSDEKLEGNPPCTHKQLRTSVNGATDIIFIISGDNSEL
jgi:hypothetical protein